MPTANSVPAQGDPGQTVERLLTRELDRREGDSATVAAIKADVRKRLFLSDASYACTEPPPAAAVVLAYVYAPPSLGLALNWLDQPRRGELPQDCFRPRVRIDSWEGIEVDGPRAFAEAIGHRDAAVGFATADGEFQARLELTLTDAGWKLAQHAERSVDPE